MRDPIDAGSVTADHYKKLRLHMIGDDERLGPLPASSKLATDRGHLEKLFGRGREAAEDIRRDFLDPR